MSDKTFGQHIEDGLKSLGNSLLEYSRDTKKWNDESRTLGLISTADKLRWLEAEAYRKTRVDKDITQELQLMEFLHKTQKFQYQTAEKNGENLANLIYALGRLAVIFGSTFVIWQGLVVTNKTCLQNQNSSDYCQLVRERVNFFISK